MNDFMSRRLFLKSPAAALAVPHGANQGHGTSPFLIGRWMVRGEELHFADSKTVFIRGMQHESPQIKFPAGIPERGDPVRVNIGWDVCYARGSGKHRTLAKMVLRVKPIGLLAKDAEVHIVNTEAGRLDAEEFRPLMATALHTTNLTCDQREWWILRIDHGTAGLLERAFEPLEVQA
jgi:hypothetical protein